MTQLQQRPATDAVLETIPSHLLAELRDGAFVTSSRPRKRHSSSRTAPATELSESVQKSGGGPRGLQFTSEPELHIRDNLAAPDTAETLEMPDRAYAIFSPTMASPERTVKFLLCNATGIRYLRDNAPVLHTPEVFKQSPGAWMTLTNFSNADAASASPSNAISFQLADLWDD